MHYVYRYGSPRQPMNIALGRLKMFNKTTEKEREARDLAERLTHDDETDVTVEDARQWQDFDVYEWLEIGWDFAWSESKKEWER